MAALVQIGLFDADRRLMGLDDCHMWLKFLWALRALELDGRAARCWYAFFPSALISIKRLIGRQTGLT